MKWLVPLLLTGLALAANPQDEQVVRTAYAKLAYAVQSRTVYQEAQKNAKLTSLELAQKLQTNELRFDISEMSSGALSDIGPRPYSDFVTPPDAQAGLSISHEVDTFDENGLRFTSHFAYPSWQKAGIPSPDLSGITVKDMMGASIGNKFTRYVTATITVGFQGRSRTYHTLWLFGSNDADDPLVVDVVTGQAAVRDFALGNAYPSVLTDTSLRSRLVVSNWLSATQQFGSSCKTGKQDVCCDSTSMRCGVPVEDLQSTKPAPSTKAVPKGGL